MTQENSDPQLILSLTQGLQAWWEEEAPLCKSMAEKMQAKVGWSMVLDGWLILKWRAQEEAYWEQWKRQKSSKQWTAELIEKLWNIAWDLWDHSNEALHNSETNNATIFWTVI